MDLALHIAAGGPTIPLNNISLILHFDFFKLHEERPDILAAVPELAEPAPEVSNNAPEPVNDVPADANPVPQDANPAAELANPPTQDLSPRLEPQEQLTMSELPQSLPSQAPAAAPSHLSPDLPPFASAGAAPGPSLDDVQLQQQAIALQQQAIAQKQLQQLQRAGMAPTLQQRHLAHQQFAGPRGPLEAAAPLAEDAEWDDGLPSSFAEWQQLEELNGAEAEAELEGPGAEEEPAPPAYTELLTADPLSPHNAPVGPPPFKAAYQPPKPRASAPLRGPLAPRGFLAPRRVGGPAGKGAGPLARRPPGAVGPWSVKPPATYRSWN